MTRRPPASSGRAAFTLIELLVVIAIIGILLGLILPAVQKIRGGGPRLQAASEAEQLAQACGQFEKKFGFYPPSTFTFPTTATDPGAALLKSMFNRWTQGPVAPPAGFPTTITGSQCLVYFLSGPAGTGWAIDAPVAPSANAAAKHQFYDFPVNRLTAAHDYLDPWGTPYVYLASTTGKRYGTNAFYPAAVPTRGTAGGAASVTYLQSGGKPLNDTAIMIISAGENKRFGPGGAWAPGSGTYATGLDGGDDIGNVNGKKMLGVQGN